MPTPKPTKEQIDAARSEAERSLRLLSQLDNPNARAHEAWIRVLLSATEPPPEPAASESDRAPDSLPWALRICRTKLLPWLEDLDQPLGDAPAALRVVLSAMPPEPPSDEQLAEEAWMVVHTSGDEVGFSLSSTETGARGLFDGVSREDGVDDVYLCRVVATGARREGRQ